MFFCCCDQDEKKEDQQTKENIHEHLINKHSKPATDISVSRRQTEIVMTCTPNIGEQISHKKQTQKDRENSSNTRNCQELNIHEVRSQLKKRSRVGSIEELEKIQSKSALWLEEKDNKIVYSCHKADEQSVFCFQIDRNKTDHKNVVNYAINSNLKCGSLSKRSQQTSLCLLVTSRGVSQLNELRKSLYLESWVKPVFAVFKRQEIFALGGRLIEQESQMFDVVLIGRNSLKVNKFDRIIISAVAQKHLVGVLNYIQKVTEGYRLQDVTKIELLLPNWMTISEISHILSKLYRKFIIAQQLVKIAKYLKFHLTLIESEHFQHLISINNYHSFTDSLTSNEVQKQVTLLLSMNLICVSLNYSNFQIYKKIGKTLIPELTIIKYLKTIAFLHRDSKFMNNLQELKLFQTQQLREIQKDNKLQVKSITNTQSLITIDNRYTTKLHDYLNDNQPISHPSLQLPQNINKQWDDNLDGKDIRITIPSGSQIDYNCNNIIDMSASRSTELDLTMMVNQQSLDLSVEQ